MADNPSNRDRGSFYEERAAAYLKDRGLEILCRNYRCPCGEIDLIARDGNCLVFVEVKYRKTPGTALYAVNGKKQRMISRTAAYYLTCSEQEADLPCRFDVVGIEGDEFTWIKNAFDCWME